MLYKNNDEEISDFKLYKMIARKVHNHIPTKLQISNYLINILFQRKN